VHDRGADCGGEQVKLASLGSSRLNNGHGCSILIRGYEVRIDIEIDHSLPSQATGIHKENKSNVTGWFCQDSGFSRWRSNG
jgi:hypothetical protein